MSRRFFPIPPRNPFKFWVPSLRTHLFHDLDVKITGGRDIDDHVTDESISISGEFRDRLVEEAAERAGINLVTNMVGGYDIDDENYGQFAMNRIRDLFIDDTLTKGDAHVVDALDEDIEVDPFDTPYLEF